MEYSLCKFVPGLFNYTEKMTSTTAIQNPREASSVRAILGYTLTQNELRFLTDELDILQNLLGEIAALQPGSYTQAKVAQFKCQLDKQRVLIIQFQQDLRDMKNQLSYTAESGISVIKIQELYKDRLLNIKQCQNEFKSTFCKYINHELV